MNFDLPVSSGVGIAAVTPDSPAERVDMRAEDIIVGLAGQELRNVAELDSILIRYRVGSSVKVEFYRGNKKRTVTVKLGERPS